MLESLTNRLEKCPDGVIEQHMCDLEACMNWIKKDPCVYFVMLSSMWKLISLRSILLLNICRVHFESLLRVPLWLDCVNYRCVSILIKLIQILWLSIWKNVKMIRDLNNVDNVFFFRSSKVMLYYVLYPNLDLTKLTMM